MKTMIFPPDERPILYASLMPGDQEVACSLVEIGKDSIILHSPIALPLRGKIKFKNELIEFKKLEEAQVDELFYAEITIDAEDLFAFKVHFLARQSVENITHWIMDEGSTPEQINKQQDLQDLESKKDTIPPQGLLADAIGKTLSFFYQHWYLAIFSLILISIFPATQISKLTFDPSLDRLLVQDGREMKQYKESIQTFGPDRVAILYFEDDEIFTKEKLKAYS